jgi:hypothetical protein
MEASSSKLKELFEKFIKDKNFDLVKILTQLEFCFQTGKRSNVES